MNHDTVMLLIDADNVSVDVVEQAIPWVARHFGGPHVRRAYCTAESAVRHQALFKRLGIRPMVNLAAGKNSTDIALAVDAIDLAIQLRPQTVVIASSDSDFAPMVARLREKGCRVVGVGQAGKTGEETKGVYDDYEVLVHRAARAPRPETSGPAPKPGTRAKATSRRGARARRAGPTAAAPEGGGSPEVALLVPSAGAPTASPVEAPPESPVQVDATQDVEQEVAQRIAQEDTKDVVAGAGRPARAAPAKRAGRRRKASVAAATAEVANQPAAEADAAQAVPPIAGEPPPVPEKVQSILAALPPLAQGQTVELRVAAERLKEAGLLARRGSSTKLFGQYPEHFELQPAHQPNRVRALPPALG